MSQSPGTGSPRPAARPFVSGREPVAAPLAAAPRPRPFSSAAADRTPGVEPAPAPESNWSVVEYHPGLEDRWAAPRLEMMAPSIDEMPTPLDGTPPAMDAPAIDGSHSLEREPERGAIASEAAAVLDQVADRLRRGEIQLAADAMLDTEAAVVASVLTALLGARR